MKKILFGNKENVYKGNMHCHSNLSDGQNTPSELKELYKNNGYSFLAITDHDFLLPHSELDDDSFITITSCELSVKSSPTQSTLSHPYMRVCHFNIYSKEQNTYFNPFYNRVYDKYSSDERKKLFNVPEVDFERDISPEGINKLIETANSNGFFVAFNHPRWSLDTYENYSKYKGLWGVEVYNTSCFCEGVQEYDINVLDDMLRLGNKVFATSGDDNHSLRDLFGTFVMVEADSLSYNNVINALVSGDFYTSTGPLIHRISVEDDTVEVECSSVKAIMLSTMGRRGKSAISSGEPLTNAKFLLKDTDGYFRITIIDENGKIANSQAYFLDDLR